MLYIPYTDCLLKGCQLSWVTRYCEGNNIKHELALAYNPESNGLAEAAVKNMKSLISRCIRAKENIPMAIAAWRTWPEMTANHPVSFSSDASQDKDSQCWPHRPQMDQYASRQTMLSARQVLTAVTPTQRITASWP